MTIRNEPTLWCDGIEDESTAHGVRHAEGLVYLNEVCPQWTQDGRSGAEIRRNAKRAGWKRIDGRDYSPQCAKLLKEETP